MAPSAGYSTTTLAKKLGIVTGSTLRVWQAPTGYLDWLAPLPADVQVVTRGYAEVNHVFAFTQKELMTVVGKLVAEAPTGAALWVSWPKKASKVPTDITEDVLRTLILPTGWVDVKVCAVSEVWSGLKFLRRKASK
jgi:hypothetical protein